MRLRLQAIWVGLTVTPVATMSACPASVSFTDAPGRNPVPTRLVIATEPLFAPELGVMLVTVGAGLLTVKPPTSAPCWRSVLVTTTFQAPMAAPVRLKVQVICAELTTFTLVPTMSNCPAFVSFTLAPGRKFVPARLVMLTLPVFRPAFGVMAVTVGGPPVAVTVKPPARTPACRSVFVTTTSQAPVAAPVRLSVQVICVGLATVTPVATMSA